MVVEFRLILFDVEETIKAKASVTGWSTAEEIAVVQWKILENRRH